MPGQASCQICGTPTQLTSALVSSSDPSHGALTRTVFTIVHYFYYMTTVPNSFNMDQLSEALENAPAEAEYNVNEKASQLMNDELWDLAHEQVAATGKLTDTPLVFHKAMLLQILGKLQTFHSTMSEHVREEGAPEDVCAAWLKDAGKIQACVNILMTISVDGEDFMLEESCK